MINANELRIGNYINAYDGVGPKYMYKISAYDIDEIDGDGTDCFPIPLTPEILEKCGFSQLTHYTMHNSWRINIARYRVLSVACVGEPNEMIFLTEEKPPLVNDIICLKNYDYDGKTYLHQLQNIYFALTNSELTFKL